MTPEKLEALRQELFGDCFTLTDTAFIIGLDKMTIQKYLRNGTLIGFKIGREWRVPKSSIVLFKNNLVQKARGEEAAS